MALRCAGIWEEAAPEPAKGVGPRIIRGGRSSLSDQSAAVQRLGTTKSLPVTQPAGNRNWILGKVDPGREPQGGRGATEQGSELTSLS